MTPREIKLKEKIVSLKKEMNQYKRAYLELNQYYDSISDEEQDKVAKRLNKIFQIK